MTIGNQQEPPSIGNGWRVKERKGGFRQKGATSIQHLDHVKAVRAKVIPRPISKQEEDAFIYETKKLSSISYHRVVLVLVALTLVISSVFILGANTGEREVSASLERTPPRPIQEPVAIQESVAIEEDANVKPVALDQLNVDDPVITATLGEEPNLKTAIGMGGPLDEEPIQAVQTTRSLSPAPAANQPPTIEVAAVTPAPVPQHEPTEPEETGPVYRVQVGALPSRDGAARLWDQSLLDHNELITGIKPHVEAATTVNGEIFRLQLGSFPDRGEANDLCIELTKRGASCFVVAR
ncbi:MAG: SPOR domain-containing protein [Geminicoccales bacterium]